MQTVELSGVADWAGLDWAAVPTPCTVCNLRLLRGNARRIATVRARTGARVLLALKAFAMFSVFPELKPFLDGVCASSPHEARLGAEAFGGEVHAFAPAYSDDDLAELTRYADHLVFNSLDQWARGYAAARSGPRRISCGLRVNPEHSEVEVALYDPCAAGSRLGIRRRDLDGLPAGVEGLHFHALCEQNSDVLERTLAAFELRFAEFLGGLKWVNFGGGHHITRPDYDIERLYAVVGRFRARYPHLDVYLEPGEAVALNTGVLVASVLDVIENEGRIAILDTSAAAHMPDVLEMPYRPEVLGAGRPGERPHDCRLGGLTCLAGDMIGTYSFARPLQRGDRVVFWDMAHYTTVKNTTFNGVRLPSLATFDPDGNGFHIVRSFGYEDFKGRLS
jgi:carboxynorspermidine decarboxylase